MINISGFDISAVLFDLDNTLVDRDLAVSRLAVQLHQIVDFDEREPGQAEFVRIDAG